MYGTLSHVPQLQESTVGYRLKVFDIRIVDVNLYSALSAISLSTSGECNIYSFPAMSLDLFRNTSNFDIALVPANGIQKYKKIYTKKVVRSVDSTGVIPSGDMIIDDGVVATTDGILVNINTPFNLDILLTKGAKFGTTLATYINRYVHTSGTSTSVNVDGMDNIVKLPTEAAMITIQIQQETLYGNPFNVVVDASIASVTVSVIVIWGGGTEIDPNNPGLDPNIPIDPETPTTVSYAGFEDVYITVNPNTHFKVKFKVVGEKEITSVEDLPSTIQYDATTQTFTGYVLTPMEYRMKFIIEGKEYSFILNANPAPMYKF